MLTLLAEAAVNTGEVVGVGVAGAAGGMGLLALIWKVARPFLARLAAKEADALAAGTANVGTPHLVAVPGQADECIEHGRKLAVMEKDLEARPTHRELAKAIGEVRQHVDEGIRGVHDRLDRMLEKR